MTACDIELTPEDHPPTLEHLSAVFNLRCIDLFDGLASSVQRHMQRGPLHLRQPQECV